MYAREPTPAPTNEPMSLAADPPRHDGLANPQRALAFSTLAMATAMAALDGAIVNVGLPTIARALAVAPANSVWVVNAFQLAVTISLLPLSALGDSLGYRRVYWPGLAVFTLASLACALAPTLSALTLARAIQRVGAAGIMSVNVALVRFIYPSSRLGQGVGNIALVVAVCSAGSATVAAAILSVASWRWLFAVNVPVGTIALAMAAPHLSRSSTFALKSDRPLEWRLPAARRRGTARRVAEGAIEHADDRAHLVVGDAVVDRLAVAPRCDEPLQTQPRELLRHGRLAKIQESLQLADRLLSAQEIAKNQQARLVRQRLEKLAGFARALRHAIQVHCITRFNRFREGHGDHLIIFVYENVLL